MTQAFSIGRLAKLTGLPVKTIRFYSDAGLLPPSGRTEAGHRRYSATDVARLQLVRTLRDLDVALDTIAQLLAGRRAAATSAAAAALVPMARGLAELLGRPDEEVAARGADHAWLLAALRHHAGVPAAASR